MKTIVSVPAILLLSVSLLPALDDAENIAKTNTPIASYKTSDFVINLSTGMLLDYTYFNQNPINIAQVGKQKNQADLRAARAAVYGRFTLFGESINYFVACGFSDYLTRDAKTVCKLYDAILSYKLPENYGQITLGKMKEPWSYEMVGDSANLMQHERFLSPLFRSRNVGIRYNNTYLDKSGTYAVGIYNDWVEDPFSFKDSSHQFTGRITAVPYLSEDHMDYFHVGLSARYNAGDKNTLHYQGKPESNVADWFVDTGVFQAEHAVEFGFEALWSYDGFSLLAEYLQSNISSKMHNDPTFNGWYIAGGWVVTGESRIYDTNTGYARRIMPNGKYGALELIARYGDVDLDDESIHGGEMHKWMLGANWWINPYWKASVSYGTVTLDKLDMQGESDIALFRLQWFR